MAYGFDISASGSIAPQSATGAVENKFAPVTITNLGTGSNSALWLLAAGFAIWWLFFRKN